MLSWTGLAVAAGHEVRSNDGAPRFESHDRLPLSGLLARRILGRYKHPSHRGACSFELWRSPTSAHVPTTRVAVFQTVLRVGSPRCKATP
jgi:hypothetical protein